MAPIRAPLISTRVAQVLQGRQESWIRRMFELAASLRAAGGGPVHDLSLGNPSLEPPAAWREAITATLTDEPAGMHRYMTNAGFADVRGFLAAREGARYGLPLEASDVVMTVGAAGALNVVFAALLDPADAVLVPAPYFAEYQHYCANVSARLVAAATTEVFQLDVDALRSSIDVRTRVLLLNSPNNPTGAVYDESSLRALAAMLEEVNRGRPRPIVVVEDSPYRDLTHDGSSAPSMLAHYPHTLFITSHSKDLGLAGERIGYLVISPHIEGRDEIAAAAGFCNRVLGFVNAPALMQRVLPRVLSDPAARVDVQSYARRSQRMTEGLRALGFSMPDPKAGFFLFPRLPDRLRHPDGGDVTLTDALVARRTIVVPGTAFGVPGHLRLSMATTDEAIEGALEAFQAVCGA